MMVYRVAVYVILLGVYGWLLFMSWILLKWIGEVNATWFRGKDKVDWFIYIVSLLFGTACGCAAIYGVYETIYKEIIRSN